MSDFATLISTLFRPPGDSPPVTADLLSRAATVHGRLLKRAAAGSQPVGGIAAEILTRLHEPRFASRRQNLLCDPLLISGLHRLSRVSPVLERWHHAVAAPSIVDVACRGDSPDGSCLGHVLLALRLFCDSSWQGEISLETDAFGRIEFPGSDWLLALSRPRDGPHSVLACQKVVVAVDRSHVRWALAGKTGCVFLRMSREDCLRMLPENDDQLDAGRLIAGGDDVRVALIRKVQIPGSSVRYDPVSFEEFDQHAPVTGGLVAAVLGALQRCSPAVADEFGRLIHSVRGFEIPRLQAGTIQSFSDPSMPGVMSINVPFTVRHEPQLCPLCFCWFGHELGHTKSYLVETVAHGAGEDFLNNPQQTTELVPRYGRPLRLRTLLQIPYTHLYEWQLLADFLERDFRGLPWPVDGDPVAAGNDVAREIDESFELIDRHVVLTKAGCAVVGHLKNLCKDMIRRWERAVSSATGETVARTAR